MDIKKLVMYMFTMIFLVSMVSASDCFNDTSLDPGSDVNHYIIINATSVSIAGLEINGGHVKACSDPNLWLFYNNASTYEVNRAQAMKTLFFGTTGSDPRISTTYITGIQGLYTQDARDINKSGFYAYSDYGWTGASTTLFGSSTYKGYFSNNETNYNISTWSKLLAISYGSGGPVSSGPRYYLGNDYLQNSANMGGGSSTVTSDHFGTDRSAYQKSNEINAYLYSYGGRGNAGAFRSITYTIILSEGNFTSWNFTQTVGSSTSAYLNRDYNVLYNAKPFENPDEIFPFRINVKNVWNNESINTFNVTYNSVVYSTTEGFIEIGIPRGELANFTFNSLSVFGQTITNHNTSEDLYIYAESSTVTLTFKNVLTEASIENINVTVTGVNGSYNEVVNYSTTLNLAPGTYTVNATNVNYGDLNEVFTVTALDIKTIDYTLGFLATFNLLDERDGDVFNITNVSLIQFSLFCVNETIITEVNTTSFTVPIDCQYQKFRFNLYYDEFNYNYYRTLTLEPGTLFDLDIYLIDALNDVPVFNSFIVDDLFNDYQDMNLVITKIIGNKTVQITSDFVDAENKVGAYLIENGEYSITILSSSQPDKVLGSYIASVLGTKLLRLYEITTPSPQDDKIYRVVSQINESGSPYIQGVYRDPTGLTNNVSLVVRLNDLSGAIVYQTTSTASEVEFLYNMSTYENDTLIATLIYSYSDWEDKSVSTVINEDSSLGFDIFNYITTAYVGIVVMLLTAVIYLLATPSSSSWVGISGLGLLTILEMFGLTSYGPYVLAAYGFGFIIFIFQILTNPKSGGSR